MITTVTIGGHPIDPGRVTARSIVVTHGRDRVTDGPEPSTAHLTLLVPAPGMPGWTSGNSLTIAHDLGPLFTGRVTDLTMVHVDTVGHGMCALITLTAAGPVAALGVRVVGDEPWPAETGAQRAERILTLAGVGHSIDGAVDPLVVPRDVDAQPALTLLEELAGSTGAAVFDTPTGTVVYQAISGRARPVFGYRWQDFPPTDTWSGFPPTMLWADFDGWISPDSDLPTLLPAAAVEWEPAWNLTEAEVINHARIGYGVPADGSQQEYAEAVDETSQAAHGTRYRYIGTQLADPSDAADRAGHIISTQARPRWAMPSVVVLLDLIRESDPTLYTNVLGLLCGDHVIVHGLPQPAPAIDWPAIVEGWTYQYWKTDHGTEHERTTLALSDPLASLAVIAWTDYPPLYRWSDHPTPLSWSDLTTLTVLEAA